MKKILVSTALLAGVLSYAGGFRVSLQGVKQLAMAHTSAHAEDASVAFFNPAGMSFIPSKLSIVAGGFGASNKVTFQNLNTLQSTETDNPLGTPIYAAIAYKPLENLSVGFSFSTPFGSTIQWPNDWEGREMVQKLELKSFYFQPMVSVKLAPWLAFGASYIYARGKVDWDKAITQFGGEVNINDEKASGHGYGFGFYFRPEEKLDVSIAYRSPVDMKAKNGTATFKFPSQSIYSLLGLGANGQDGFSATLPLVEEYTIGLTYKITPKWLVSADFNYHGWERYSKLTLDFANAPIGNQADPTVLVAPKNFRNSKTFRLGTQYAFSDMIFGRLGAYYDESPYSDNNFIAETPSFNTYVVTGGVGFKLKQFGVDIAGGYAMPQARDVNNANLGFYGQAKARAFYFGLGLSYNPF
ncbi:MULTISPECIES: OmpP1/FadL family transporter [Chryseobacterium]|uniref:OmpP1/FadL family transporter n=1 Tax=Chryseobacterium TaxID=59732 RepID=UPI001557F0CD|nr:MULTISPECIES: outer membrane protein transport protein [unclassified Chryseobacterium]MDC8106161.1 outer membrane protein transport protein [Chryseobacterium sp. B21-037]MDQ1804667.1 outer membrane protein transport protein [Chryseobacterium sp. CKR4-1]WBV55384.1 outer membrane protein transport protein [Chryseobacterium daecheongense]